MDKALDWFSQSLEQGLGLSSPFCPLYVLPSLGLCLLWLSRSQVWTLGEAWVYLCDQTRQHARFIRIDGTWALFQIFFLRAPLALFHGLLFQWSYENILKMAPDESVGLILDYGFEALLATLLTMLAIDFAAYAMHRALHEVPGLFWIHRLHHQAVYLSPLSTLRQHPLEPFLLNGARALAAGLVLGALHILLPQETPVWTLAGMGPGFFLYMFTVNLHHAPLPIQYPRWTRSILISPHIHHLHHSKAPEHYGKNYGVIFSFWDRWLGTYWDQDVRLGDLEFGLEA